MSFSVVSAIVCARVFLIAYNVHIFFLNDIVVLAPSSCAAVGAVECLYFVALRCTRHPTSGACVCSLSLSARLMLGARGCCFQDEEE